MSRIGKKPVALPKGVTASVEGKTVKVKGPKGELSVTLVEEVDAKLFGSVKVTYGAYGGGTEVHEEEKVISPSDIEQGLVVSCSSILVTPREDMDRADQMWGLSRTLVNNLVLGVTNGFSQKLEIQGVGYRAAVQGKNLHLQLGFSHDVAYPIPDGITIAAEKPTMLTVSGIDKQLVGQVAAEIRAYRPPEPYKGKGVRYAKEYVRRKEGKKK
jgi:large subunit ribosomal protein L6